MKINFKCDRCEGTRIEEILVDVVQRTVITDLEKVGDDVATDYGDYSLDGGEIEGYCCMLCGKLIVDDQLNMIETPENLMKWLTEKGMIAE